MTLPATSEPLAPAPPGFALWQLGFRPFYLVASIFAALTVPLWALQLSGWLPRPYLAGPQWHGHEMVFGFTAAVIVGFLFTAGKNWSRRPTPTGPLLQALVLLWIAGRVLVLTPWPVAAAVVNVAFPLAAAVCLAVPFFTAGNRRNYFFLGLLVMLGMAQLAVHLEQMQVLALPFGLGLRAGLDVVLFVIAVMAGRVIPMFTNNGVPGARAERRQPVERMALGSILLLLAFDVLVGWLPLAGVPLAVLTFVCAAIHLTRWLLWRPFATWRVPLVAVLHVAYAWIPVHLAMRGLAELGFILPNLAVHALTVGAIGGLTIGMMTRTARGHTGHPLRAGGFEVAAYLAIFAAAVVRVGGPLVAPGAYVDTVLVAAGLWSLGYAIYAVRYAPMLLRARIDGLPG